MAFCSACGAQIPEGATVCAACSAARPGTVAVTPSSGLADNVAGMLAYITIIPAIIFLVIEPYNKSRFVRFHSFQCIFFTVAVVALHIVVSIFSVVPLLIFITFPLHALISLGALILWIVCLLKANQGQMYKLPVIGDMAEKQAG